MKRLEILAVVVALASTACGNSTTPTTPTTTTVNVTDTFSGTLSRNGAASYPFITASSGAVVATLTSLAPDSTQIVGLSLGTWNGSACAIVLSNDKATQSSFINGASSASGSLCARIYDVGNVTDPIAYEIRVVHP